MKAASSLARKHTAPGMSSGWPTRFIGIALTPPALPCAGSAGKQGSLGRAGADRIERDALASDLARHRLGEGDDAALARRVDRLLGGADAPGVRGDVDHAPVAAPHHALQHDM